LSRLNENLPEGWERASIVDLCEINPKHSADLDDSMEVSFVPMAAVSDVLGRITTPEIKSLAEVKKGYTHFADGDVIFAKITPCMENGKAASVRNLVNGIGCGTTEFFVLRSHGAIDQDYLYYFVRQESYRKTARATMQSGVGQARVPKEFIESTELPVPPLTEQRRIVLKIEDLQERSRKAREALAEVKPLLEQFRQSVLAAAFRGDLTADWRAKNPNVEPASELLKRIRTERRKKWEAAELAKYSAKNKQPPKGWQDKYQEPEPVDDSDLPELPEGWCWCPLEELAHHQSGFAFKSNSFGRKGVQVVKLGNLYQGRFDLTRDPTYLPSGHEDIDAALILDGDILVSQTGTRHKRDYGHFVQIPNGSEPLLLNQRVLAVRPFFSSLVEWIVFASRLVWYREHFFSHETGGVNQGNVGIDGIMRGPIPLASQAEMIEVCRLIANGFSSGDEVANAMHDSELMLTQLDQSILAKVFCGELVPQDPSDEPASVLLERIRQQRKAMETSGNRRKATSKK